MKNKIVLWLGVVALFAAPAQILRAQEGPEGGETEDIEITEGRPGPARAEMEMHRKGAEGRKGARGMHGMEEEDEPGEGRMTVKVRKVMGGGRGMGGRSFLSEEETIALIKKHDPAFAQKVEDLKDAAPPKYHMIMQLSGKILAGAKMEEDAAVEKDAVRMLALEFEVKEQSRKLEKAQDSEKGAIKDSIKVKLSELFDLKSKGQELRVKRMETDLAKLKKNLESRKANKAKIVQQRMEQLTGEGYGW